jgi:hypothetical protein
VPLIERKAEARLMEDDLKRHKAECPSCGVAACHEYRLMQSELRMVRREIRDWFKPGPDQPTLL